MGLWDLFKKKPKNAEASLSPTVLAAQISPLLDELNHKLFLEHQSSLMREPIDYVVPAVWGAKKEGSLNPEQREMHQKILPYINRALNIIALDDLNEPQKFAVDFLLRGLIINRLTYTIAMAHNRGLGTGPADDLLENLETVGTA
jgi:hypothetical protein